MKVTFRNKYEGRVVCYMPRSLVDRLMMYSIKRDIPVSQIIRQLVRNLLDQERQKQPVKQVGITGELEEERHDLS